MEELETKVKKLELNNSILKLVLVLLCMFLIFFVVNYYSEKKQAEYYYIYLSDQINGTYDKIINADNGVNFAGVGTNDIEAEVNAYMNERKLYFKN